MCSDISNAEYDNFTVKCEGITMVGLLGINHLSLNQTISGGHVFVRLYGFVSMPE